MVTMFISTSGALPKTSYVKMIDVWYIYCLVLCFLIVILNTITEGLIVDEDEDGTTRWNFFLVQLKY